VALHGMEQAAGVRYREGRILHAVPGTPVLVRYADLCRARHKSAYAEVRIMPMRSAGVLVSGLAAVRGSA
jgi:hypothetical protein